MLKRDSRFLILLVLFIASLSQWAIAQSHYFKNYSVEDGLPFVNVSTIFQDSKGNLWSGGYGGLSQFDGISFTNYSPKNGLLNHAVTCINEDNQGDLWVGTISGLNKISAKRISGFTTKNGLPSNSISSSIKDATGSLWFGTNKGLTKLVNNEFVNFSTSNGLIDNEITCLFQDKKKNLWVGTPNGISVFDGTSFVNYNQKNGLPLAVINAVVEDANHVIWIATNAGLYKLENHKFMLVSISKNATDIVKTLVIDNTKALWVGTENGLFKFENQKFQSFTIQKNKNSNLISYLYTDYESNLWIGTYAGLFRYRANPFISYGVEDGLSDQFVYGILRDSNNVLWVGSKNSGLFKMENSFFKHQQNVKAKSVNAIFQYKKNEIWLASDVGLILFDGNKIIEKHDTSSVFNSPINCIYRDSKGNVWIGGLDKVFKFDGKKFTSFTFKSKTSNCNVWTIAEDLNGTIWLGTYLGGLVSFDGKEFKEQSSLLGLQSDSYLTSVVDSSGTIYWGTLGGVCMFNPQKKSITYFNEADGLNSDLIYSSTFGKTQNELWVGTNQGLSKINLTAFKASATKVVVPFGKEEGFSGVECNSNGTWVDNDGTIWFGTVNGLIRYNPDRYIKNEEEAKTNITGFRLFYNDTVLSNNIHLAHYNNNITFHFIGICLTNPDKVQYSHILKGFEKKWSPPDNQRMLTYSNLPPGTYTFSVISSNSEGLWNKHSTDFTFTIEKPFWKKWWFIISLVIVIVTVTTALIQLRIQRIKNREKRKTELNKKIAHIESQALRAQMNPHFIFNTLSSIQHYISNNNTDAALKYLSKFAKLMRKIMENSKQPMVTVTEELNALHLFLELEVMRFDKKFDYTITVDKEVDPNYDRIPSMLIQPYVENAIIHGLLPRQGFGKISITLEKLNDTILCIIEDNGIGRENSNQFKKNRVQQHKSMGMSITQERLDVLNAGLNSNISCEIIDLFENGSAAGTRVRLIIPLEVGE